MWQQVLALIEDITANTQCAVDRRRVYLTGVSMGGLGTWMLASRDPGRFAALVPICGGGSPVFAPLVKHIPCWFFHSSEDNVIGVEETDALVQAMQREEAVDVRYTRYVECPDPAAHTWMVGHNSWTRTYAQPALWAWLLKQSLPPAPVS
jgi:predicted peptidase